MKDKKIIFVAAGIIVLVIVFYGGMYYQKIKDANGVFDKTSANRTGQFSMNSRGNRANGGGFVGGQIISKDDKSITVKIMNNDPTSTNTGSGSKIIFFDTSTTVSKTVAGVINDLAVGTQVSVSGTANSDGSVTAKSIQIRPQIKSNTGTQ